MKLRRSIIFFALGFISVNPAFSGDEDICFPSNDAKSNFCCHPAVQQTDLSVVLGLEFHCTGGIEKIKSGCNFSENRHGDKWRCTSAKTLLTAWDGSCESPPLFPVSDAVYKDSYLAALRTRIRAYEADPKNKPQYPTFEERLIKYSESAAVTKAIKVASKNLTKTLGEDDGNDLHIKRAPGALRLCYRYTKVAMRDGGMVNKYLVGSSAQFAGPTLEHEGFINLMDLMPLKEPSAKRTSRNYKNYLKRKKHRDELLKKLHLDPNFTFKLKSPKDAPRGAVLVYNRGEDGHIELKTKPRGQHGYISDYYTEESRTGDGIVGDTRTLIGVYVKI